MQVLDIIYPYLVAILPALTALGAIIAVAVKIIKNFADLKKSVEDKTNLEEAKSEMKVIIQQNAQLRREVSDLITAVSKVKYNDKEV